MTSITPTTTGKVFLESRNSFLSGIQPSNELPKDDPFSVFWDDFRNKIITPMYCQLLLEAFVCVYSGSKTWAEGLSHLDRATHVQQISDLIRDQPPDIVILDVVADQQAAYGEHLRRPDQWPYICISRYWINQWKLAMAFDPTRRLALALEAVLRATLVHELGHWFFTLRVGPYPQQYVDAFNSQDFSSLSPEYIEHIKEKDTPESMGAEWKKSGGEAGYFVELNAGGGVIDFHPSRDDVCIRTDVHGFWSPSTQYLITMREKGYALFLPGPLDMPMPHPPVTLRVPMLPAAFSNLMEHTPSHSRSPLFSTDYREAIKGGSYSISMEGIPNLKHGDDRILPPSAIISMIKSSEPNAARY